MYKVHDYIYEGCRSCLALAVYTVRMCNYVLLDHTYQNLVLDIYIAIYVCMTNQLCFNS